MKPAPVSETTLSLADFQHQASALLNGIASSKEPVVITQDGCAVAVLVSPSDYADLREQLRFVQAVKDGLNDVEHGRLLSEEALEQALNGAKMDCHCCSGSCCHSRLHCRR
ncbi:prevent-host-death family protein [Thiorhodovibrio frisius]|uniref:Antitoxin n=2 Tax=Thiorhodovibrio frisius TaxID=631362 RepID=H8Z3N2_9GAMM|nr:prevent-host-death family protein [Thiorhodovibrio frisius]WPL20750.1 prevent-host-death family protein [Thiorhodovibrio frisius]